MTGSLVEGKEQVDEKGLVDKKGRGMSLRRRELGLTGIEIGATVLILLAAYVFTANYTNLAVASFPEIGEAFRATWLFDRIGTDLVPSLLRLVVGFALAVVVGVALGVAMGTFRVFRLIIDPVVTFLRSIPPVALIPPAIVLLGIGDGMKLWLIVVVCIWPIALNVADGVRELDVTLTDTARVFQFSRTDTLRFFVAPAITPRLFAGMQISLGIAFIMVVGTELLAGTNGIGYLIAQAQANFDIPQMWAGIVMIAIFGYVINLVFTLVRRRALFWAPGVGRR